VLLPPRINQSELLLLIDQDGSMVPFHSLSRIAFPQAKCGDPLPQDTTAYPVNLYPVFINYSDRNFSEVKSKFCQDALSKVRENGQRAIQVASFLTPERAEAFKDLMIDSFGSGEVGEPAIIDRVL